MRNSSIVLALFIVLSSSAVSSAQDPAPLPAPPQQQAAAPQDPAKPQDPQKPPPQDPQKPPQDPQKPPAAAGEEATKPTRNFGSALVHNLGDDFKHLPRLNTVYFLAGGGALAAAVHPADDDINQHFIGNASENFFRPGKYIGNTGVILAVGTTTYVIGRVKKNRRLQHLGMDEIEGQIMAGVIVIGLKESVRRERPLRSDGTRASGFSFPSGHATSTFAAATILQQHLGYKAGVPTYLIASYVALSRLHENVHFLSDVVFGATLGTVVGRTVTWHGRNFYASPMLIPGGTGIIVNVHAARPVPHS